MKGHNNTHQTKSGSASSLHLQDTKRSDKAQPLSPFLNRFLNVHYLINPYSPDNHSLSAYFTDFSIIKHLQNDHSGRDLQLAQPNTTNNKTIIDTFNRTGPTIVEDEDSQYLNYLKQYESVVKKSRRDCISPVNHKQEINQLISQFLSDKCKQQDSNAKSVQKKGARSKNITPIKIQKIDLNILKTNHAKCHQLEITAHRVINENNKSNNCKKEECISPRFINITQLHQEQKGGQSKKQIKPANSPRITVIKVEKPKNHPQKQQVKVQSPLSSANNTMKGQYQQTYIKKKIAKLQKTEPLSKKIDTAGYAVPISTTYKEVKASAQKIGRKPIKIQIQIPQQDSEQQQSPQKESPNHHMKNSLMLQDERQQIIKQISERVMTLLHKNKPLPNNQI